MEAIFTIGVLWFFAYMIEKYKDKVTAAKKRRRPETDFDEGQRYDFDVDLKRMNNETWDPESARAVWGIPFLGEPDYYNRKHDEGTETYNTFLIPREPFIVPANYNLF